MNNSFSEFPDYFKARWIIADKENLEKTLKADPKEEFLYEKYFNLMCRAKSNYDFFGAGHASTSVSAALGFAHARDKNKTTENILAIIGDGAMTGGLAYEALNNLGYHRTQLTVILNDNSLSISKSVGALSRYLTRITTNPTYNRLRRDIWDISGKIPLCCRNPALSAVQESFNFLQV